MKTIIEPIKKSTLNTLKLFWSNMSQKKSSKCLFFKSYKPIKSLKVLIRLKFDVIIIPHEEIV